MKCCNNCNDNNKLFVINSWHIQKHTNANTGTYIFSHTHIIQTYKHIHNKQIKDNTNTHVYKTNDTAIVQTLKDKYSYEYLHAYKCSRFFYSLSICPFFIVNIMSFEPNFIVFFNILHFEREMLKFENLKISIKFTFDLIFCHCIGAYFLLAVGIRLKYVKKNYILFVCVYKCKFV